ncbi:O-antigen ligase family protein [Geminicoccaceae bacterium 1502E]|nr:O-antigen ligase family protein [Geminicoccaceae bacterium 1502E]
MQRRSAIDADLFAALRVLRRLAVHLFSFETLFLLFLFAGRFKADPRLAWVPVDLTLLFFAASLGVAALVIRRERVYLPGLRLVMLFLAFTAWAALSWAWTAGPIYGLTKIVGLMGACLWAVAGTALVIANRRIRVIRFLVLLGLFAVLLAWDWLSFYGLGKVTEHGFIRSSGYLNAGTAIVGGALAVFTLVLYARPLSLHWSLAAATLAFLTLVLFIIGGRSPIVGMVVAMMVPMAIHTRLTRRGPLIHRSQLAVLLVMAGAALAIAWTLASGEVTWTLRRFGQLFAQGSGDSSTAPRIHFILFALESWARAPILGHGLGSFGIMFAGADERSFPHNIFLEAMHETGTTGLLLMGACFVFVLARLGVQRLRHEPALLCALMVFTANMVFSLISGAFAEDRFTWASLGLLLMRPLALARPTAQASAREPAAQAAQRGLGLLR